MADVKLLEQKQRSLKLKLARLISDIDMLSEVQDSAFLCLGKTVIELHKIERKLLNEVKNIFDED